MHLNRGSVLVLFFYLASSLYSLAQVFRFSTNPDNSLAFNPIAAAQMQNNIWLIDTQSRSPLETQRGSLSKLDLKAPGKAKHEYKKGYELLMKQDLRGALEHLTAATTIYPSFVAAHNALGSTYLGLVRNEDARVEFARAVELDDHLPLSYFNLGCAQLALKEYPSAEKSIQKASEIAPLDVELMTALAYGQLMNENFDGAIDTAKKVHARAHDGASIVHFYAAAALEAQQKYTDASLELDTLLKEDPISPAANQISDIKAKLKEEQLHPPSPPIAITIAPAADPTGPVQLPEQFRKLMQDAKENRELAEAEAAEPCAGCPSPEVAVSSSASPVPRSVSSNPADAGASFILLSTRLPFFLRRPIMDDW
jgi:tetratricopeptide (TPR) repeat protein